MPFDQLVPYWDNVNAQFQGPNNVASGSNEILTAVQATGATATIALGIATKTGIIKDVRAAAIAPITGNDTLTVDVKRNGVSVLTGVITLDNTETARQSKVGTLVANVAIAVGDFFEVVFTYTHGTGTAPTGVIAQVACVLN